MQRTYTAETPQKLGEKVRVAGWVHARRDHGKLIFIDLRDKEGLLQIVFGKELAEGEASRLRPEWVVEIEGEVAARPENMVNPDIPTGTVELKAAKLTILNPAESLPFDMGAEQLNVELPTLLDYRSLTLKHPTQQKIFKVQATVLEEFRRVARDLGCIEVVVPTIAAGATEGGAEVFKVDYYGHTAYLTQSPQLYKQMMVGVFERVFVITKAYRAEPSVTTRHLSEITQLDVEIAFIDRFEQLLDALEFMGTTMIQRTAEKHADILKDFGVAMPLVPQKIPRLTLREAQKIIFDRTGRDLSGEDDLNAADEKEISEWAREEHQSDFVTITHYPTRKRAFYTMPDPENPEYSLSYDLLFRGLEMMSGSQRVHQHDELIQRMRAHNVDPKNFEMYLMSFKYGMPPEGGFSFGLERLTMKLLELANIREASLFPRDMERVDTRFAKDTDVQG